MNRETTHILLVEDNPGDARLIQEMLTAAEGQSFALDWVHNLAEAVARLDQGGIDLVLLDLGLPDSQGMDTFIRAYEHGVHLPFLVLTGYDDEALGSTLVGQGAQDYLPKGEVTGNMLCRAIRYAIERKQSQLALETERQKLFTVLNSLPAYVHLKDANFGIRFANRRFKEIFGKPGDKPCYQAMLNRTTPCEPCRAQEVMESRIPQKFESSAVNGRTFEVHNYPLCANGDLLVLTLGLDITERKLAEEALKESEARFRTFFENAAFGAACLGLDGRFIQVNDQLCRITGYEKDELLDLGPFDLAYAEPDRESQELTEYLQGTAETYNAEKRYRRKDGKIIWVQVSAKMMFDSAGKPVHSEGIIIDITKRKQAEEEKKLNERRLESLLRISQYHPESIQDLLDYALHEALMLTDSKVGYLCFYDEIERQFTLNTWLQEGMKDCGIANPRTVLPLEETGIWGEAVRQGKAILVNDFQSPHPWKKGYPEGHMELYKYLTIPVFSDRKIVAVVGVANKSTNYDEADVRQLTLMMDATWKCVEGKQAEETLLASQKKLHLLATQLLTVQEDERKRLSRELHDELGHALLTLKLGLRSIEQQLLPEQQLLSEEVEALLIDIDAVINNVRRLYLGLSPGDLEDLGLTIAIKGLINEFSQYHRDIKWSIALDKIDDLFPIKFQTAIYRIFQEILTNIGKYADPSYVSIIIKRKNKRVIFEVEDNGKGFNCQDIANYSAKSGMGLIAMEERLRMMGGSFKIWSREKQGTRINFIIPIP